MRFRERGPVRLAGVLCGGTVFALTPFALHAQEVAAADDTTELETVVVTGSRGKPRTVSESPVPIDVFSQDTIEAVPLSDTNDLLQTLIPSYSVQREPISDGSSFIRSATLRGLSSDKTLVLVNSKRRHRAALVEIGGSGTQGPDVATIPSAAIKSVEVLRDGAAAQYGSDAIAGVINFILKDNSSGGSLGVDLGQYYEGDGFSRTVTGNIGLPLGPSGFLSISGEYNKADYTDRSEQYCESWFCADPNGNYPATEPYMSDPDFLAGLENASLESDHVQPWGQPNAESARAFYNAGITLGGGAELYSFGNYSWSEGDGSFYYRYPHNGTIEYLREPDGSLYWPLEKYPGGFTPRFFGEIQDYSTLGGIKGVVGDGFAYDFSARYGYDEISYTLKNTINPSMGPDSPTSFKPGDLVNEEVQVQADFSKEIGIGTFSPLLFAFGASYLDESYEIKGGEEASYFVGPYSSADPWGFCENSAPTAAGAAVIANGSTLNCADPDDPVYQAVGVGSNGFPGYSPEYSGTYSRDSYGVYLDISTDLTDRLFVQAATRYEDYSDFGDELVGKLAAMFRASDAVNLRASVGTGFRAPTPGQQGTTNVSTRLPNGFPVATGLFPAGGDVAQALGAEELSAEKSLNYTFGTTINAGAATLTIDFYRIDIDDQLYAVSTKDVSATADEGSEARMNYDALVAAGVAGANTIGGVFFFQNAFDSRTQGVDVVATYPFVWGNGSSTDLMLSLNYNERELRSDASAYLNDEDAYDFENITPEMRGTLTATHKVGPVELLARANYYGSSKNSQGVGDDLIVQKYGAEVLFDISATYHITESLKATIGANNVFDQYPDKAKRNFGGYEDVGDYCCGELYQDESIVSWQGGYYFASLKAEF